MTLQAFHANMQKMHGYGRPGLDLGFDSRLESKGYCMITPMWQEVNWQDEGHIFNNF